MKMRPIVFLVFLLILSFSHGSRTDLLELANEFLIVQFNLSTGEILSINYQSQLIEIRNESSQISIENRPMDCSQLVNSTEGPSSVVFTYACVNESHEQLISTYTLQPQWKFIQKQILFRNNQNRTITSLATTLTINNRNIPSVSIIQNRQDLNKEHTVFLRTDSTNLGLFGTWQHPFAHYVITSNNRTVTSSYDIGVQRSYTSEGFLLGFYSLSHYWHTDQINYAERQAYENATSFFYPVPQRKQSIKLAVGWDSNDYQIDIATAHGIEEYLRLIDRCAQLGIQSLIFAPSNTNVSQRDQGTDNWGWESILWLSLGEKIRLEQWKPFRDPIPSTIQRMLDYAQLKQVKLVPYVYPPLGYRCQGKDQYWLYPSSNCRDVCASLASVEFQEYFLQLLIDFAQLTGLLSFLQYFAAISLMFLLGIGGYAWDYNFFYDSNHTEYSQWRGWQWIRRELLLALPDLIMDHRYASQFDGPWSWITLNGYTSPLLSDENPETYPILYSSLHTDKIAADFMRRGNRELRLEHFASMDSIPGFIGHQSDRYLPDGSLPWTDDNLRDFDLMGFPYSLLSNIATAGLNLVHTYLPARDLQEYHVLPAKLIEFWSFWLSWTDEHQEEIRNAIPFNIDSDWSLIKSNGLDGFLFLFNPTYPQMKRDILLDGKLQLAKSAEKGYWLLKEIYPQERFIQLIEYNQTIEFQLDGQSVTVYQLMFMPLINQPILVGVTGRCFLGTENLLIINGVYGEPGTETRDPIFVILSDEQSAITNVLLNGNEMPFKQINQSIILTDPLTFPGLYLPRSAPIINNTIIVSDLLLTQLSNRLLEYPIAWTDDELQQASWLGPHRLLLFLSILNPNDQWNITARINNQTILSHKAYNTRDHIDRDRFMGFYLDLTKVVTKPNVDYYLSLELPPLDPGQFQGLFLENIDRILVEPIMRDLYS